MICPNCKGGDNYVTETRAKDNAIIRRRRCKDCKFVWKTRETNMPKPIAVKHAKKPTPTSVWQQLIGRNNGIKKLED